MLLLIWQLLPILHKFCMLFLTLNLGLVIDQPSSTLPNSRNFCLLRTINVQVVLYTAYRFMYAVVRYRAVILFIFILFCPNFLEITRAVERLIFLIALIARLIILIAR